MKKLFITILAALTLSGAFAQEAFPDIPAGHWASEAVSRIADLGIVIGFPDGTFRGNEGFTRYQASLVVSRMLDVVNADIEALSALHEADLATLRNALQELASDVAAQDVRLGAAESAIASISDQIANPVDLTDLQNQIDAARLAADTAARQAAEAAEGAALARQNAAAIDAINDLLNLLNEQLGALTGGDLSDEDISNLREFVILLRRDQVALRDRVAALEAADADQAAAIDDLSARVATLEEQAVVFSGSIELTYRAYRTTGANEFDVDRVWGANNDREIPGSNFSTGSDDLNNDGDEDDDGEETQDREDITASDGGDFDAKLNVSVLLNRSGSGAGSPRALNNFEAILELNLTEVENLDQDLDDDEEDFINGYVFTIGNISTTFNPIGAEPLTFQFGEDPEAEFTEYVFDSQGPGFVATVGTPDFLAFLDPTLTFAYGAFNKGIDFTKENGEEDTTGDAYPDAYYRAIRGTLTPLAGDTFSATGGFSFAQLAAQAGDFADVEEDNETITVYGLDGQLGISIVDLNFEYANASGDAIDGTAVGEDVDREETLGAEDGNSSILFVEAIADVESAGIPILKALQANYRSIDADWYGISDGDDRPFDLDQAGFKVEATVGLFIVDVSGYFDSYSVTDPEDVSVSAFGAETALDLFAGFGLEAYYRGLTVGGEAADSTQDPFNGDEEEIVEVDGGSVERDDNNYETAFGVELAHDGAAENALISNLNLSLEYSQKEADFSRSVIDINADYTLDISILNLTPYAQFTTENDSDEGADDTTTIKVGTGVTTEPLGIIFAPALEGAVNFRTTAHTETEYTATELQYSVGLVLNEFLFDNSVLRVRYGAWNGTNIQTEENSTGTGDTATDISSGDFADGGTQSTTGYEIAWDYSDLLFSYGVYSNNRTDADGDVDNSAAQAFKIAYIVSF